MLCKLDDPQRAPEQIESVLLSARVQSRPVYIEIPRDLVNQACLRLPGVLALPTADPAALDTCADEILQHLQTADRPVLVVGVETRRYGLEQQVGELAARLNVPVVTTFMGRGLLVNSPVPPRGAYVGLAGDEEIKDLVEGSDAPFLLGVLLSDTNFGLSERKLDVRRVIHAADGQVSLMYHVFREMPLHDLVGALIQRLPPGKVDELRESSYPRGLVRDGRPVTPTDIATAVNDLFDRHGTMPIATDIGDCLFTTLDIENTETVAPGYYATMGFGVPAGLGLQCASARRTLIIVGDGAFRMTGWELANCAKYGWDPIVLVFNNSSWEMLRAFQPESKFNDLDELNFAVLAGDLGGDGYRVRSRRALADALESAYQKTGRFQLIEVMLERGVISNTLSRFVDGFKKIRSAAAMNGRNA